MVPILVCLALGLAGAVLLAWSFAALTTVPMYPRETIRAFVASDRVWHTAEISKIGVVDVWWGRDPEQSPDLNQQASEILKQSREPSPFRPVPRTSDKPPSWGTMRHPTPGVGDIGSDTAFGWPLPCLWYKVTGVLSQNSAGVWQVNGDRLHGGILIQGEASSRSRGFRALPLRPIAVGLVVNTLAFATPVWLLLIGWRLGRRSIRLHRGLCANCGYDRRGVPYEAPCPECGAPRVPQHGPA